MKRIDAINPKCLGVPVRAVWCLVLRVGVVLAAVQLTYAERPAVSRDPAVELPETEEDSAESVITRREGLLSRFGDHRFSQWLEPWHLKRKEISDDLGLQTAFSYHSLFQGTPNSGGVGGGAGELTLDGSLQLFGAGGNRPLDLRFRARHRHDYLDRAPSELRGEIGSLWGTTDGFSAAGFEVPEFYLRQQFPERSLELRYGQMVIDSQFDKHSLRGAKQSFLNQAFSSNPAAGFPRFGAGMTLHWKSEGGVDVTGGFSTVQGTRVGDQVDFKLTSGDLFAALQLGRDFPGWAGDPARWQIMVWHSDAVDDAALPGGEGISATLEQKLEDERIRFFARFSHASGGVTNVRNLISFGMGRDCGEADLFGVAAGLGQANGRDQQWQGVIECFYRWQVGPQLHLTPDIQFLMGDGSGGVDTLQTLFGLRASATF